MRDETPIVAVDFDGTIVDHRFPEIGAPVPEALRVLRRLVDLKFRIIVWTMRSEEFLKAAQDFMAKHLIDVWSFNANPTQHTWSSSPKAYAHYYIDDSAIGCPLLTVPGFARPCVDWRKVEKLILRAEFGDVAGPYLVR